MRFLLLPESSSRDSGGGGGNNFGHGVDGRDDDGQIANASKNNSTTSLNKNVVRADRYFIFHFFSPNLNISAEIFIFCCLVVVRFLVASFLVQCCCSFFINLSASSSSVLATCIFENMFQLFDRYKTIP